MRVQERTVLIVASPLKLHRSRSAPTVVVRNVIRPSPPWLIVPVTTVTFLPLPFDGIIGDGTPKTECHFQENMMTTDVQVEPSPRPAGAVEGNYLFTDCTLPRTAIWSWSSAGLLILGVLTFCAKLLHLQTSRLAGDEFEHIHAAWLVYNHQIPYADFFEHHTP